MDEELVRRVVALIAPNGGTWSINPVRAERIARAIIPLIWDAATAKERERAAERRDKGQALLDSMAEKGGYRPDALPLRRGAAIRAGDAA